MTDKLEKHLEGMEPSRRDVLRKLVVGSAFAAPVAVSYLLGSAKSAEAVGIFGSNLTPPGLVDNPGIGQIFSSNTSN